MGFGKWIAGALGWAFLGPIGGILAFYFTSRAEEAFNGDFDLYTYENVDKHATLESFK